MLSATVDFAGYDVSNLAVEDIEVVGVAAVDDVQINGESHQGWTFDDENNVGHLCPLFFIE